MNACPTCGRPKLKGAILDYENRILVVDGQFVHLSWREADLMSIFVKDPAFTFTTPEILDAVWGASTWPKDWRNSIHDLLRRLRRKIASTTLRIVNVKGHGYGLRQNVGVKQ